MSEGEAWLKLVTFIHNQERVTFYEDGGEYYIEWFNEKGGFQWAAGKNLIELVEAL